MSKLKILVQFTLVYVGILSPSIATTFDRDYLQNFVKTALENSITAPEQGKLIVEVSKLDPRISFKPCLTSLTANIPEKHNGRNVNVKIVCADDNPWQIFIPARIQIITPILVARSRLAKGSIVDESTIEIVYRDSAQIRSGSLNDVNIVKGARLKRNVSKGAAITNSNICFVCKGQQVTLIAQSDSFQIKTTGTSLKDGRLGEQISVKNNKSGRIVYGQVSAINQVLINL
jgi:flagella basal body P-ring formation protein FlgA